MWLSKALKYAPPPQKKKKNLVSGNAGDEKNLHSGGRKLIFLNRFFGDILLSSLVSFAFFVFCFFVFFCLLVCFLKLKTYILIHIRLCGLVSNFLPAGFRKQDYFFLA